MTALLPRPWRGIVPPMITPLCGPDALDVVGLERLIDHILAGRVPVLVGITDTAFVESVALARHAAEGIAFEQFYRVRISSTGRSRRARSLQNVGGRGPFLEAVQRPLLTAPVSGSHCSDGPTGRTCS